MNESNLKYLYDGAKKVSNSFTMDYETFKHTMADKKNREYFYDGLRKASPKFTMTNDEVENLLGFVVEEPKEEKEQEQEKTGFLQRTLDRIQQAQPYVHKGEEDKKAAEIARQEQAYQNVGITDEDKKKQERVASLEAQAISPISVNDDGTFEVNIPIPTFNQFGMPTNVTRPVNPIAEKQLAAAKANLPSYLKRGEDSPEDIMLNAAERALNTEEGKNAWNTLFDAAAKDFHTTKEFTELLQKYSLGEVTEQDINDAFNNKYGNQIFSDFIKEISREGGVMYDYITVADKKFNQRYTDQTSKDLENRIDAAIKKDIEEKNRDINERYKDKFGVYPNEDPYSKERLLALQEASFVTRENWSFAKEDGVLSLARKYNDETRTLIDAVQQGKTFWGGVGDAASDLDTWDLGIGELVRSAELMSVIKKIESNKELTSAEELLMESALNYFTASAYYSNELGRGYKAGQTSMASVPFMLQFVLSSGTLAAMEASVKGAVETGRRVLVSGMIKYAKKKGNAALAKYGAKKVAGDAGKMVSGVISGAASSVIGAGYMTGVYGLPRVVGGTIERMTGELDKDWDREKGGYKFTERKNKQNFGEALWNSFADNYIENLSEMVLAKTLDPVKAYLGGTNMFKNIARNDYIGAIVDLRNNPALRNLRQTTQFGGYFEEVAEEYLGGILRRMLNTDVNTWQEAGLDLDGQIDIFLGLAPTSLLFGTYGVVSHYGGIAIKAKELREYLSTDEQKEMFDRLMSESRSGEFGDVAHNFIRNVLTSTDPRMTVERKKEILMSVANKYHNLLSEELQNVTTQVTEQEAKPIVDELTKDVMHEGNNAIYATVDSQGNPLFIVGGNVRFTNDNVVDLSSSDNRLQVRYVKADHTLGDVQEVRAANLTMPVTNENVENFSKFQMAKFIAQSKSLDNFEFDGHVYSTEGEDLGTVEEFNTLQGNTEQTGEPKIDTKPRTVVNEEYTVTVDGEKKTVKITSMVNSPMIQNEDGSIKEGKFSVTVNGEVVRGDERKQKYIDAISEQLKEKHAKALEAYRAKQAENTVTETPSSVLTDEDRVAAAAEQERMAKEAEKQTILASAQQKKAKKYTPEETVVVLMEQGNDVATRLVGSRIDKLHAQIDEINADETKDELEKWEDSKELSDQLAAYEQAITKWLGQETLDAINAARAQALQNTPPVQGEAPAVPVVQAPVVEQAQDETSADAPTGPDTTPLPLPDVTPMLEGTEGKQEGDGKTPAPDTLGEEGRVEGNEGKEKIIDVVQDMEAGRIKAYYSKNGGGQWYVTKDGVVVAKSEGAKQSGMPNNAKEVTAKLLYLDVNGNKEPVILITSQQDYTKVRGGVKIVNEYGIKDADSQSLFSREVDEKGKESFKQINKRVSGFAKLKTLDELLSYPLLIRGENKYFTMKDLFELGYKNAKTTTGNNKVLTPYQQVREMVINDNPTYDDEQIDLAMRHFANQFQEAATRWNEIIDSTIIPNLPQEIEYTDELKIANTNINTGKTGDKQTAIASFMNALGTAWEFGVVDTDVNLDVINTIPKRFNDLRKDSRVKDRSLKLVLSDLKNLEKELNNEKGIHQYEDNEEGIKKARKKLTNYISQLSDTQVQALANHNDVKVLAELDVTRKYINERLGKITPQSPTKPAPKKDTSALKKQLSIEENSLRDLEEDYKRETDEAEKSELEGYIAQAKEKIAKLKAEIDGAEFMVGQENSQPLTEAEDLSLAAALQSTNGMVQTVSYQEAEEERQRNEGAELMGSRVNRRMAEIAKHFNGKGVTNEQQVVVDVFSGKSDKQVISIPDANGNIHNVEMQQGNENRAGTKHAVFRHYNTKNSPINADDILLIPEIIREGAVNVIEDNGKTSYEYKMNINNSEYTLITEKRKGDELFVTFYKNGKAETSVASDTQQGARNNNESAFGDKGTTNFSNDQINSQNNSKTSFFIEQDGKFDVVPVDMIGENSVVLGYAKNGKIYLTPAGMNANTIIHEYTHIWAKALQQNNPKAWKSIVDTLKNSKELWNEVLNDPNYDRIKNDEDAVASEVLSRYSGKRGAERLNKDAKRVITEKKGMEKDIKVKALIARVRKALTEFWSWVGKNLFDIESFSNINEIADRALYDMLNNTKLNLDNSKKSSTFAENNENYERTDEFRELQERSLGLSQSDIARYQSEQIVLSDEDKRGIGGVFQRLMESERNGGRNGQWINLTGKGNQFKIAQVNPAIFHDIFQICRNYLPNGELVDLHDNYADCKCFISEDGLCGFAIEPDGNLISVFSLNPRDKKGFLYAIKDLIRQEGATHLDCFVSNKQPLSEIYQKVLGFHVASEMDYNMELDHDNIAENHGMPKVAFMVDKPTEKREFDKDSYDAAAEYQQSQTSTAEREQIIAEAKANGTFMTTPNGQPTNLTEDQWVATRTQAFKDYFGDWINDKDNASVVLDENGEPLVTYHGSRMAGFDKFGRGEARDSQGIYTTPNRRAAESYATSAEEWRSGQTMPEAELGVPDHHGVYSLFVNMRNPKVIDFEGKEFDRFGTPKYEVATNEALNYGERGILFDTLEEAEAYIAEHPEEDLDYVEKYTTSDDMLLQAKEEGYDGVIFTNIIDSRYPDPITNYVPFEPNQVKSATQNVGTFNPEDDRIEFMIGPAAPTGAPRDPSDPMHIDSEAARRLQAKSQKYFAELANPKAQLPSELSAMNELVAKLLDRTEGIRQIMESIKKFRKENGLPPMGEGFDVRTMVEAMDSKIANETKLFVMTKENELRKAIYKLAKRVEKSDFYKKYKYEKELKQNGKKSKLTPREIIERYLIACDSIEREELKGNPRGAGDFLKRMGVDMVQYRQEFLDAFANTQEGIDEINHLWETIRGVTDMVISEGERSGLISQEEAISYKRRRFYVPERDFAEVEANEELQVKDAGYGSGRMGNKLMATQEAEGGETLAANVLANMTLLARDAIVKANKNIVKLAMFDLLRANEEWCKANHVPIPRQVWYKRNADGSVTRVTDGPTAPEKKTMRDLKTQIRDRENEIIQERMLAESATDAATRQAHMDVIAEIEEEIESLRQANPFLDEFDARDMTFLSRHTQKESTVTVFVDGVPCEMHFPNMTIVANALNGTTNKKFAAEGLKKLTNAMSATMTVYNPAFFTVNVVRDIPFILAKGYAEYGWQFPMRFAGQLAKTFFTWDVWKAVAGNYKDVKSPYVREFFEGGGNTGYGTIPDINRLKRQWKNWFMQGVQITLSKTGDVISFMNTFSEVWTRLAAYSVVRDMGGTKEDGVRAAKNLSVNFNRKGLGAPIWDTFMNMSFFANAALQGASGFYRTFKGNKDTIAKNVAVGFRAANAFLATPMFAGFISTLLHPDDDDELLWINDWDRDNYWYIGESGFRIAINEQIKPAWVIGVNIALGMKGRRTKEQIASSIISSVLTNWLPAPQNINGALTMATNSHYRTKDYSTAQVVENLFIPQAMASFTDIANNVDFMGYKIKNESGDLPAYMSNENSALLYKIVAEFLYKANGGDKDLPSKHVEVMNEDGTIDYKKMSDLYDKSPKEINAIMSIAIGSTWKDIGNAVAVVKTDGEFVPTDYQTIKRFYKPADKEMTILSIMREARGITKDYTEQMSNYENQLVGSQLDGNTEKERKALERIENLIGKGEAYGDKEVLKELVNAYDANTLYSYAKLHGMNETQFRTSLEKYNPELLNAFDMYNVTTREELVRKILTLTRDIKDMEVKTIKAEEWINEITE